MLKRFSVPTILITVLLLAACSEEPEITGSFSIQASASPNKQNIIELQEIYQEADQNHGLHPREEDQFHSFRIYYGEYGSLLEDYKEIKEIDMPAVDGFDVVWNDDEYVVINIIHRNVAGEISASESYVLDFQTETLEKQAD